MSIRFRAIAVLAATSVLAGCSAGPVSQASALPPTTAPGEAAPTAAAPSTVAPSATAAPSTPAVGSATPAADPASPAPAPTGVPPKPGNPSYALVGETPSTHGVTAEYRITWTSPDGAASEFLVYGVTKCLRYAKKNDGTPCLVRGMPIPRETLKLLGRAPGDARSMTVSWEQGGAGPGLYAAVLMRATNAFGDSIFTIVHSEDVCYGCTY
jgi:hypothetical protein